MARMDEAPEQAGHWEAVGWTEKILGTAMIVGGVGINQFGNANGMGWLLVGVGVAMIFPPFRPLLSRVVNALPGLPNKSDD